MDSRITTAGMNPASRSRHWHEAIASTYFPLELAFKQTDTFEGELLSWQLGELSLSRLCAQPTSYRRLPRHLVNESEEEFLITVPTHSEVYFSQSGQDVRCNPGGFIFERSNEPYEFSHSDPASLWVLKVSEVALSERIRAPGRFCSLEFDARNGTGGLFTDMLQHIPARIDDMTKDARATVGEHLIELLALSVESDGRTMSGGSSAARSAHLVRIEQFLRNHLSDPLLSPERVALACGISTRYLHELFRDTNQTLGQWIRDQRLLACKNDLKDPNNCETIATIAYSHGFTDQAQFSRAFKNHFEQTPKDYRNQHRKNSSR